MLSSSPVIRQQTVRTCAVCARLIWLESPWRRSDVGADGFEDLWTGRIEEFAEGGEGVLASNGREFVMFDGVELGFA